MSDLISRQAAIDILYNFAGCVVDTPNGDYHRAYEASRYKLETLPSAQPGRKKGRWIDPSNNGVWRYDQKAYAECSVCGKKQFLGYRMDYCPNCGADMRVEEDEQIWQLGL